MTVCVEKFACVGPIQTQVYLGIGAHKNLIKYFREYIKQAGARNSFLM